MKANNGFCASEAKSKVLKCHRAEWKHQLKVRSPPGNTIRAKTSTALINTSETPF